MARLSYDAVRYCPMMLLHCCCRLTQIEEAQDLITKPLLIWQIIAKR